MWSYIWELMETSTENMGSLLLLLLCVSFAERSAVQFGQPLHSVSSWVCTHKYKSLEDLGVCWLTAASSHLKQRTAEQTECTR